MFNCKFYKRAYCNILRLVLIFFVLGVCGDDSFFKKNLRSLKILMVVSRFPKLHDVCMLNQIIGLINLGHDVYIFAGGKCKIEKVQEDVKKYGLIEKTFYKNFSKELHKFDIVMFQLGHEAFNIKREFEFKGKLVICLRGYDMSGYIKQNPSAYDELFSVCDLFLPVCELFKNRLIEFGGDPDKIVVIHSAINCSRFTFKKRYPPKKNCKLKIVSVGRFVEKKGFKYAILAITSLIRKYPNIRYSIIGGGALEKKLKGLIKKLNMSKYIKIISWQTHEELIKILNNSHIFIAPSVTAENGDQEGIPNVLKEAMAMGLPVIGTRHAGITELIENGTSGFLVNERDMVGLEKCIEYLITHPKIWAFIGKLGRKKIKMEFNKNIENKKLSKVLEALFV